MTPHTRALAFSETFAFEIKLHGKRAGCVHRTKGHLFRDDADGQVYIIQYATVIKERYTDADRALAARLAAEAPVEHGDLVTVDGRLYRVNILGDYSDAGRLTPIHVTTLENGRH